MNRFRVGGRVLKTVLAVTVSIFLAQQLGLERVALAALVALLTVQRTFYRSLVLSLGKLGSVLLGAILGTVFGYLLGNTPLAYGLATLFSILICLQLRWQENIIITNVTAITIILSDAGNLGIYSLKQTLTGLLAAACALVINYLFTPNHEQEVTGKLRQVEENLRRVVDMIIEEMLNPGCNDDAFHELVDRLKKEIQEGMVSAKLLREEQRFIITRETASDRIRQAFHILNFQLDRLEEMHKLARRMPIVVPQVEPVVKLFRVVKQVQLRIITGKNIHQAVLEQALEKLDASFDAMELPQSREEFVSRASLFHLFQEIKKYYRRTLRLPDALKPRRKKGKKKKKEAAASKTINSASRQTGTA